MTESQSGAFAIDNVLIGSSASNTKSTYNDTYVVYNVLNCRFDPFHIHNYKV